MKFIVTLLTVALTLLSYHSIAVAQINTSDLENFTSERVNKTPSARTMQGSPFFHEQWLRGKVILNDEKESEELSLRYDTFGNVVQFQQDGEIKELNSAQLEGFIMYKNDSSNEIIFKNGFHESDLKINQNTFLRIIEEGEKATFAARHQTQLHEGTRSYATATTTDKFINEETFYIIDENENLERIKLRKRHITRALSDMKDKIEQYTDENNLSYRDENDVARIVAQYNKWKTE